MLAIEPDALEVGTEGEPYSMQLSATGGSGPYTFTAQNLPPGFAISTSGQISGTPESGLEQTITVTVTDAMGCPPPRRFYSRCSCSFGCAAAGKRCNQKVAVVPLG